MITNPDNIQQQAQIVRQCFIDQFRTVKEEVPAPKPDLLVINRKVKVPAYIVADVLIWIVDKMHLPNPFEQEDEWVGISAEWDLNIVSELLREGMWQVSAVLYPVSSGRTDTSVWMQVFEMKITYKKDE